MEHGSQKAGIVGQASVCLVLVLCASPLLAQELRYQVRHDHMLRDKTGELVIDEKGVAYKEGEGGHGGPWKYEDIQQLSVGGSKLVVVTYKDRAWRLGADQEYEFTILPGQDLRAAYELLRTRLDRRFVAALADATVGTLWEIPVKLTGTLRGSEGVLKVGPDHIVYETARRDHSRTWRMVDIENVSSTDPHELTIVTYERAKLHYGSRRGFTFQLKAPLSEERYNLLWRRIQRHSVLN
jgi:hypothetical protein